VVSNWPVEVQGLRFVTTTTMGERAVSVIPRDQDLNSSGTQIIACLTKNQTSKVVVV
jgi:hypothetical protein